MSNIEVDEITAVDPARLLEIAKNKQQEMSSRQATIEVAGRLYGRENNGLWEGKISLDDRINNGEIDSDYLEVIPAKVNRSFVPVSKGAALRCVDGSSSQGYDKNSAMSHDRPLGPQIQGGIAGVAQAMRLWLGPSPNTTLLTDIDKVNDDYLKDYSPGDHTDDTVGDDLTGCGAIDKYTTKLAFLTDPSKQQAIKDISEAILASGNKVVPTGAFDRILKNATDLSEIEGYLPPAKNTLAKIRSLNPSGVEVLVRPHPEASVTINWVSNTTHDRDAYNAETDSKIGNFNLDAWAIFEEFGEEIGYAVIVDAVATKMAITDGSQLLLIRTPVQETILPLAA